MYNLCVNDVRILLAVFTKRRFIQVSNKFECSRERASFYSLCVLLLFYKKGTLLHTKVHNREKSFSSKTCVLVYFKDLFKFF